MGKVTVYQFWRYDGVKDETTLSPTKRTAADIEKMGFVPVPETAEEVDPAKLDWNGRYHPKNLEADSDDQA